MRKALGMDAHLGDKPLVFSVVVPVYNSQEFVERCIDSVLSQEHEALELILVDDGSTDDSFEICSSYSATDQRVRVIKRRTGDLFLRVLPPTPTLRATMSSMLMPTIFWLRGHLPI